VDALFDLKTFTASLETQVAAQSADADPDLLSSLGNRLATVNSNGGGGGGGGGGGDGDGGGGTTVLSQETVTGIDGKSCSRSCLTRCPPHPTGCTPSTSGFHGLGIRVYEGLGFFRV
jgi:hypothetical protein